MTRQPNTEGHVEPKEDKKWKPISRTKEMHKSIKLFKCFLKKTDEEKSQRIKNKISGKNYHEMEYSNRLNFRGKKLV